LIHIISYTTNTDYVIGAADKEPSWRDKRTRNSLVRVHQSDVTSWLRQHYRDCA